MTRTAGGHRLATGSGRRGRSSTGAPAPEERGAAPSRREAFQQRTAAAWQAFLHDRSVRSRVAALVLLPLLTALVLGALTLRGALADAADASTTERNAAVAGAALEAAHRVQDERDVTGLAETGATSEGAVADARGAADVALADVQDQIAELDREEVSPDVSSAVGRAEREMAASSPAAAIA